MNNNRKRYYFTYTILFAFISLIIFSYYYLNNRTFINSGNDGLIQHYKALLYYSEYLKTIITNIFNGKFIIPHWDFNIGEGSDVLQTLHFYTIGDPLSIFSIFFNRNNMYVYYDLSILIRLYLAGIIFSNLCFYTGKDNIYAVLAGSFAYIFSYWGLLNVNEHIYFLNPLMYLPLIILGIEMIIKEDKPYIFALGVFLSALSNFYFFYMIVLLTIIYVIIRFLYQYHHDYKLMINKLIKLIIFSVLATLMAAVIVFPVLSAFLNDRRVGVDNSVSLLYSRFYYERLPMVFLSNDHPYDLCMGFVAPVLLALGLIIKKPKENLLLVILMFVTFIFACLPFAGKVLNGFAYVINRWSFAIALVVSYILVHVWDRFNSERNYLFIFTILFVLASMVSAWNRSIRFFIPIIIGLLFIVVASLKYKYREVIMLLLIIVNIAYIADYDYSSRGSNRVEYGTKVEEVLEAINNSDAEKFKRNINDNYFYRYSGTYLDVNAAMLAGLHSTDFYWSVTNPNTINYREKLALPDFTSYILRGYDNRTIPNALASTKYYLVKDEDKVPYGYHFLKSAEGIDIYENEYHLPFAYTYENSLSYDSWNKLNPIEKQATLIKYIVVENGDNLLNIDNYQKLNYQFENSNDIIVEENRIIVNKAKSELQIKIENTDVEKYLYILGLEFIDTENNIEENNTPVVIRLAYGNNNKLIYYYTRQYQYYAGRHDFSICLNDADELVVKFPYPGIYTFDELSFAGINFTSYNEDINRLKKDKIENLIIGNDSVELVINASKDEYLLFTIPYTKGWDCYVDGDKVELLQANEIYSAIKLDKGYHQIQLKYHTPLLGVSTLISMISSLSFIYYIYKGNRKK